MRWQPRIQSLALPRWIGWSASSLTPSQTSLHRVGALNCAASARFQPGRAKAGSDAIRERETPSPRSEEHTSELQALMRTSSAVFCWKIQKKEYSAKVHQQHPDCKHAATPATP